MLNAEAYVVLAATIVAAVTKYKQKRNKPVVIKAGPGSGKTSLTMLCYTKSYLKK